MIKATVMWNHKVTDFPKIKKRFDKAAFQLNRATVKTRKGVAQEGMRFALRIAPVKSGRLKQGINYTNYKNSTVLWSRAVNPVTGFPYNFWVNEDIKTVKLAGKDRTYASCNYTGMPGYFDLTYDMIVKILPNHLNVSINKVLKQTMR